MAIIGIMRSTKFSDGGTPAGWPPTPQDYQMRIKHTTDSVEYNVFDHAQDHLAEGLAQLGKLYEVDRSKAEQLSEKICKFLDKWCDDFQKYKNLNNE